jgi:hypothetical protein
VIINKFNEIIMKRGSTIFLKVVTVLIGSGVLAFLIRLPLTEGRAANLDLVSIYWDPFIVYMYAASISFFLALQQAFKLLGYIGENKVFSLSSVKALRTIKYCAVILGISIVLAALYIRLFHAGDDDPAGFIAVSIVATFLSAVIATAAAVFEKLLQNAVDLKAENDLTV